MKPDSGAAECQITPIVLTVVFHHLCHHRNAFLILIHLFIKIPAILESLLIRRTGDIRVEKEPGIHPERGGALDVGALIPEIEGT